MSTMVLRFARGWRAMFAAWIAPMRPAPNWQKLIMTDLRLCFLEDQAGGEMATIRLTMTQALVRYLAAQKSEIGGIEQPLFAGVFAIFGHGNVAGIGEALYAARDMLPTLRAHNEQAMALAAIAFAKACLRRRMM